MKGTVTIAVLLLCSIISADIIRAPPKDLRKQLQGPPSEFSDFVIPDPATVAHRADSALLPVYLKDSSSLLASIDSNEQSTWTWTQTFPVDTQEQFSIALISPHIETLELWIQAPDSSESTHIIDSMFSGDATLGKKTTGPLGIDGASVPSTTYTFFEPQQGEWTVEIKSSDSIFDKLTEDNVPEAFVLLDSKSQYKLFSHLASYDLEEGSTVGVVVRMYIAPSTEDDLSDAIPESLTDTITEADLDITLPDGSEIVVKMHDDGLHSDLGANDGVYGGSIKATTSGNYVARAIVAGSTPDGRQFLRTTQHLIGVAPIEMFLTGSASAEYDSTNTKIEFLLNVDNIQSRDNVTDSDFTIRTYAEVWGVNKNNEPVPIGWMQAMADPVDVTDGKVLMLELDENWVKLAEAQPPFTLKNVVLQDRLTNSILSSKSEISVEIKGKINNIAMKTLQHKIQYYLNANKTKIDVTEKMRYGARPAQYTSSKMASVDPKLLLIHGYCSGAVWPLEQFTNAVVFEDFSNSRSNDQFALKIRELGELYGSFGTVAHSQGGLASLHLKTYYWSGLDVAASNPNNVNGRLIQSVGSPYKGCSLSGLLASIGYIFGFGCGSNFDLSVDGAALWYSKIPKQADGPENDVFYFTTRYDAGWWFFSDCVTASNLVLHAPNDGTCEIKYSQLTSGHNMGTTEGWCHVGDMKYPPQCTDPARNAAMNKYAAR